MTHCVSYLLFSSRLLNILLDFFYQYLRFRFFVHVSRPAGNLVLVSLVTKHEGNRIKLGKRCPVRRIRCRLHAGHTDLGQALQDP